MQRFHSTGAVLSTFVLLSASLVAIRSQVTAQAPVALPEERLGDSGEVAADPPTQQWGTLTGRFVYDGDPPAPQVLDHTKIKDADCFPQNIVIEGLLVDPDNKGIANVILFLEAPAAKMQIHPDYQTTATDKVSLKLTGGRFNPHVTLLRTSQTLVVDQRDKCAHNYHPNPFHNTPYCSIVSGNEPAEHKHPLVESLPMKVVCDIHPWMQGWIVVRDTPYMAATDSNGKFTIKDLPVGTHTFRVWHERIGYFSSAFGETKIAPRGRLTVTIQPGMNDLGSAKVAAEEFEK